RVVPRRIAQAGPAVVCLDHVTKSPESRGRYALGAVHKLNGLNGAAYLLENRTPFGVGITGRSTVLVAKDRPGQLRRHALPSGEGRPWSADLAIQSHDQPFAEAALAAPTERPDDFRPTVLMHRVSDALTKARKPLSKAGIEDRVHGQASSIRLAIAC